MQDITKHLLKKKKMVNRLVVSCYIALEEKWEHFIFYNVFPIVQLFCYVPTSYILIHKHAVFNRVESIFNYIMF